MKDSLLHSVILFAFIVVSAPGVGQGLDTLHAPKIWLRADIGKASDGVWEDQTANNLDGRAQDLSGDPLLHTSGINYNKALIFDGIDDYLQVSFSLENLTNFTILSVYDPADSTERGVWGAENTVTREILMTTKRVKGPEKVTDIYGGNDSLPLLNTIVQNWGEKEEGPATGLLAIGSTGKLRDDKPFKGKLAELIVFDTSLPFMERIKYQTYLAIKYGIPLSEGNYVSSIGKVLWNSENNKDYKTRITGIGRDDSFKLIQKQAVNAYDSTHFLKISIGKIAETNEENEATINDQDFLIWGDNGATLTDEAGKGQDTLLRVVNRKWLINATGYTASKINTSLGIDISQLPKDSIGYWLVIDQSGSGDFRIDNLEYFEADSVSSDSIAWYNNIFWDTDGSGSDVFGFARSKYMLAIITGIQNPDCIDQANGRVAVKMIGGRPSFKYSISNSKNDLSRSWVGKDSVVQEELTEGHYSLRIIDADGHAIERTFDLVIPGGLKIDLGEDTKLPENKELELDASLHIPDNLKVSYLWESNYGFSSTEKKVTLTESGIYTVTVSKDDGCEFKDQIVISGSPVKKFVVSPNITSPGKVKINISLHEPDPVTVQIIDAGGSIYYEEKADAGTEFQFTHEMKNTGIYLVVLNTPKGLDSRKLIIH